MTAPPFRYYGGKTTLATTIADLLPAHDHYVEPFAGSLAVLLAKPRTNLETVNDLDGDLMTFWRVLRDCPAELARVARLTPYSRGELEAATDLDVADDVERARRVWVRLTQSRQHSLRARPGWKYEKRGKQEAGGTQAGADYLATTIRRMEACAARLRSVSLECRDAVNVIRDYGAEPTVCIYADPPYLGNTRATNYRHEMTSDQQHRDLADALNECKATVVLSGYAAPLYEELFDGWHCTRLKGAVTLSGDTDRVEVLWSNRPLGEATLFDGIGA